MLSTQVMLLIAAALFGWLVRHKFAPSGQKLDNNWVDAPWTIQDIIEIFRAFTQQKAELSQAESLMRQAGQPAKVE